MGVEGAEPVFFRTGFCGWFAVIRKSVSRKRSRASGPRPLEDSRLLAPALPCAARCWSSIHSVDGA